MYIYRMRGQSAHRRRGRSRALRIRSHRCGILRSEALHRNGRLHPPQRRLGHACHCFGRQHRRLSAHGAHDTLCATRLHRTGHGHHKLPSGQRRTAVLHARHRLRLHHDHCRTVCTAGQDARPAARCAGVHPLRLHPLHRRRVLLHARTCRHHLLAIPPYYIYR